MSTTVKNPMVKAGCAPYKTCSWCGHKFTHLGLSRHWDKCAAKKAQQEKKKT